MELRTDEDAVDGAVRQQRNAVNYYHSKKSHAEGMMDISLLTANANQLKFILYYNRESPTYYPALALINLSLILQIIVGILLIFRVSQCSVK
jgi:Ninjurin